MKRTKPQPSLAGLLLIVTGMLLISMTPFILDSPRFIIGMSAAAIVCLAAGIVLSRTKKKRTSSPSAPPHRY